MLRLNPLLPREKDSVLRGEEGKCGEGGQARTEPAELSRGLPGALLAPQQSFPSSVKRGEEACEILLLPAHSWASSPSPAGTSHGFGILD